MAKIGQIEVKTKTGDRGGANTDGEVYLGICGRELLLDTNKNDFERGETDTFVLGRNSNSRYKERSDPSGLDTKDLNRFPMWIRFEPDGTDNSWNAERVLVTVNPGNGAEQYEALRGREHQWLGDRSGQYWFLLEKL